MLKSIECFLFKKYVTGLKINNAFVFFKLVFLFTYIIIIINKLMNRRRGRR